MNFQESTDSGGLTGGVIAGIIIGSMGGTFLIAGAVFWHKKHYGW